MKKVADAGKVTKAHKAPHPCAPANSEETAYDRVFGVCYHITLKPYTKRKLAAR